MLELIKEIHGKYDMEVSLSINFDIDLTFKNEEHVVTCFVGNDGNYHTFSTKESHEDYHGDDVVKCAELLSTLYDDLMGY